MAQSPVNTEDVPRVYGCEVAVLTSKWYPEYVEPMTEKCVDFLNRHGAIVDVHVLPGTLEFPFAAAVIANVFSNVEAIICLSVVLQGETKHFDMIVNTCAQELATTSKQIRVPIINEILPVTDLSQAAARSRDDEFNKGLEAAVAAMEMIYWTRAVLAAGSDEEENLQ